MDQKPRQDVKEGRRNRARGHACAATGPGRNKIRAERPSMVLKEVLRRENLLRAYQRVKRNRGAWRRGPGSEKSAKAVVGGSAGTEGGR